MDHTAIGSYIGCMSQYLALVRGNPQHHKDLSFQLAHVATHARGPTNRVGDASDDGRPRGSLREINAPFSLLRAFLRPSMDGDMKPLIS